MALKCAFDWKCITPGTCGGVKLVRISWSHPISASSRQGGKNVPLWEVPYFFYFLKVKFGKKGFIVVVVVVPLRELCPFGIILLKASMDSIVLKNILLS